jgi:16S rRNA (guanine966-N2)-methyltransferase
VTRIIAGFAGSLLLAVPGTGTRPTSDRVREAIFSSLEAQDAIAGAHVVDLYAGSGALGLEAASRGATSVILVERHAAAAAVCRDNAARVRRNAPGGVDIRISVARQSVQGFLEVGTRDAGADDAGGEEAAADARRTGAAMWDLAFLDPPYELGEAELARALDSLAARLSPDAVVVLERSARSPEPAWPPALGPERRKTYGDTTLWWLGMRGSPEER